MGKATITFTDAINGTQLSIKFSPDVDLEDDNAMTNAQEMAAGVYAAIATKMVKAQKVKK